MEYNPIKVNYKILDNNIVVHKGEIYSVFLDGLSEIYIDYDPKRYKIEIEYQGKTFLIESPY
jgi:hypothetical protein